MTKKSAEAVEDWTHMTRKTIFTLNARSNASLGATRDHFNIQSGRMFNLLQEMFADTEVILRRKGIQYEQLKTALVPSSNRREIALIFDSTRINGTWYGRQIFEQVIPLLSKDSNHCILQGDYIGESEHRRQLYEVFAEHVQPVRDVEFRYPEQFFIVYINNLSDSMFRTLKTSLDQYEPYIGHADATYSSKFNLLISAMLGNVCLKHRDIVIMGHEDDRDNNEDVNLASYPFEDNGFTVRSLQSMYYSLFLEYKIQRPVFDKYESDSEFSINAIHPRPTPLNQMKTRIDPAKHGYLTTKKGDSLKRIGLIDKGADDLKAMIANRIHSNYIYNMTYDKQHGTSKFDILLEVSPSASERFRVMVALEYLPDNCELRLITLY
jgi:hypothetical protein